MELGDRLAAAVEVHRHGDLDAAEAAYREILDDQPEQPDALHFLGLVAFDRGAREDAAALIRRSVAAFPANPAAHNNLGNVLKALGRREEALEAYNDAIEIDSGHADTWNNIGTLLRGAGNFDRAIDVLSQAVQIAPDHAEAWHNLGMTLMLAGRFEESADAFERSLALGQRRWSSPVWYATILGALGRQERAVATLERHLETDPADPVALHQLAALRDEAPARASDDYVRTHFNGFAHSFDEVLAGLQYRAPELIAGAVARRRGDGAPLDDVVDLGCGTGLCGPLIREYCGRLIGVDLSRGMLAKAAEREVYDHLVDCELVEFLENAAPIRFDLAVSADTLIYIGAFERLMAALTGALKPGGALIATVERLEDEDGPGYRIERTGRYAHRADYLRATAEGAGLVLCSAEPVVLRRELGSDVHGLLFEVERPRH